MKGVKLNEISEGEERGVETRLLRINRMAGPGSERDLCALFTLPVYAGYFLSC